MFRWLTLDIVVIFDHLTANDNKMMDVMIQPQQFGGYSTEFRVDNIESPGTQLSTRYCTL